MDTIYPHLLDNHGQADPGLDATPRPLAIDSIEQAWVDPAAGMEFINDQSRCALAYGAIHGEIFSLALELSERASRAPAKILDAAAFFNRHGADSSQGIALMMLAESLARAPDDKARQALLFDILPRADWDQAASGSGPLESLAKMSSRFASWKPQGALGLAAKALGEAGAGKAALVAIGSFAKAFVAGTSLEELSKLSRSKDLASFDMLGESASTDAEAQMYFERYMAAIERLAATPGHPWSGHGISVKMSALDPLFDRRHLRRPKAFDRLMQIAQACQAKNLLLTIDAEEAERLAPTLEAAERAFGSLSKSYEGFGWAIQANLRACGHAIEHALDLAHGAKRRIPIRLVKGAYWDSETRKAIAGGYASPAWGVKAHTDRAWLAGAEALLRDPMVYPMLATHNPHSCAAAILIAHNSRGGGFEFQRLHGMGSGLHAELERRGIASRSYSPIGKIDELLPYLARRMLENGANTSILRQAGSEGFDPGEAFANPFSKEIGQMAPTWEEAFGGCRDNSPGHPLWMVRNEKSFERAARASAGALRAGSAAAAHDLDAKLSPVSSPCDRSLIVGSKLESTPKQIEAMLAAAHERHLIGETPAREAASKLAAAMGCLRRRRKAIVGAIVAETGKRVEDALSEWREAHDFCAYHSRQALIARAPRKLPSLPGEENWIWRAPRGPALCVGPWNFPFAILMGQASAALAAGCPAIIKGASASSLCAQWVVDILREAGFSATEASHAIVSGSKMAPLLRDDRIAAVAFTGSTQAARSIAIELASRPGAPAKLIAETGGFNLMLVDESAHLDSACADILESAFNMSGQRCSALRCAWIDDRVFDKLMAKLAGALMARSLGDPIDQIHADYGPLIDEAAAKDAEANLERLLAIPGHALSARALRPDGLRSACYFAPAIVEVKQSSMLREEMFAPILQCVRFKAGEESRLATRWAQAGYGLTFGIQTRKPGAAEAWAKMAPAGNIYINRPIIGATVGSQPFGGEGLSGSGPKIGGPDYVAAFCVERSLSNNSAAFGGCLDLLGHGRSSLHHFFPQTPSA